MLTVCALSTMYPFSCKTLNSENGVLNMNEKPMGRQI